MPVRFFSKRRIPDFDAHLENWIAIFTVMDDFLFLKKVRFAKFENKDRLVLSRSTKRRKNRLERLRIDHFTSYSSGRL